MVVFTGVKKQQHTSNENPVKSIQSDDDFQTPEVLPLCVTYALDFKPTGT